MNVFGGLKYYVYLFLALILFNAGCTGKVGVSTTSVENVEKLEETIFIKILSNTTSTAPVCSTENQLVILFSAPAGETVYCRDKSEIISGFKLGPVCEAGVEVEEIVPHNGVVDCQEMILCGQAPTKIDVTAEQFDGTPILKFTYDNLPWACRAFVEYSTDESFDFFGTFETNITPPPCNYCERLRGTTCLDCIAQQVGEISVLGRIIPDIDNCGPSGGEPCDQCPVPNKDPIDHGQTVTMYQFERGECGLPCSQASQTLYCNDGTLMGNESNAKDIYQFQSCRDPNDTVNPCECIAPDNSVITDNDDMVEFFNPSHPACLNDCEGTSQFMKCEVGLLTDALNYPIPIATQLTHTDRDCPSSCDPPPPPVEEMAVESQSTSNQYVSSFFDRITNVFNAATTGLMNTGECVVPGYDPTPVGQERRFYRSATGNCTLGCDQEDSSSPFFEDRLCTDDGFTGNPDYSLAECSDKCGCSLELADTGTLDVSPGNVNDPEDVITLYKNRTAPCGRGNLCEDAGNSIEIVCIGPNFVDLQGNELDKSTLETEYRSANLCDNSICNCLPENRVVLETDEIRWKSIPGDGAAHQVVSTIAPTCPNDCNSSPEILGTITCVSGVASGDTDYHFKKSACVDPVCACDYTYWALDDEGNETETSSSLAEGEFVELTSVKENNIGDRFACSDTTRTVTLHCDAGFEKRWTGAQTYDSEVHKYKPEQCKSNDYRCKIEVPNEEGGNDTVNVEWDATIDLTANENPACQVGPSCQNLRAFCKDGVLVKDSDRSDVLDAAELAPYPIVGTCTEPECSCTVNGHTLTYNQQDEFFAVSSERCNSNQCGDNKGYIKCFDNNEAKLVDQDGAIINGGSTSSYVFRECFTQSCACELNEEGSSLLNGMTLTLYKNQAASCENKEACDDNIKVTCLDGEIGQRDPEDLQSTNLLPFDWETTDHENSFCEPAICTCQANNTSIEYGASAWFYNAEALTGEVSCASASARFDCDVNGELTPEIAGHVPEDFPYTYCSSEVDQGDLGGTGGGTGNDEGPGAALKKRQDTADPGSGGESVPCRDGAACSLYTSHSFAYPKAEMKACELPWSGGEIEYFGTVVAFDEECVELPDTCENHRQMRTCKHPVMTGSDDFKFNFCETKEPGGCN